MTFFRRKFIPQTLRDKIKAKLSATKESIIDPQELEILVQTFNQDLSEIGQLIGVDLTCDNFIETARNKDYDWT
jgi:hypothetical protein